MRLLVRLSIGVFVAILAAPGTRASTVTKCPTGTYGVYYVLLNEPVANALPIYTHLYNIGPNPTPPPDLPSEPRRFDELLMNFNESPPFYAMCSGDAASFETAKGIQTGSPLRRGRRIPAELYEVLDLGGTIVGTVWRDQFQPFDQGGSIGGQSYWSCVIADNPVPVVNNFAGFSSGLDPLGMNGVDPTDIEQRYFRPIRERLTTADRRRMEIEGCTQFPTKADFLDAPNLNDMQVWFRNYDPSSGYGDIR